MEKHLEIKTVEHKGIKVIVKIDYDSGDISLMKKDTSQTPAKYIKNEWIFANRSIEYMQGWLDILDAMAVAIKQAKNELGEYQEKKAKELENLLINESLKDKKK